MDFLRFLVILLVALPAATAILVAALGPGRRALVRQICLGVTIADAVVALVLAAGLLNARSAMVVLPGGGANPMDHVIDSQSGKLEHLTTFRPEIVPGS